MQTEQGGGADNGAWTFHRGDAASGEEADTGAFDASDAVQDDEMLDAGSESDG